MLKEKTFIKSTSTLQNTREEYEHKKLEIVNVNLVPCIYSSDSESEYSEDMRSMARLEGSFYFNNDPYFFSNGRLLI